MKGVVLAGGEGTRLRPLTNSTSKQLLPVANKPVLQYGIETLAEAGVTDIAVVLGTKNRDEIREFLADGYGFGVDITYVTQDRPLGVADAVNRARDFVADDDFVLFLGDNIVSADVSPVIETFREGDYHTAVAVDRVDKPERFGVVEFADDGTISRVVEKPDDPPSDMALTGVYVFSPRVFEAISSIEPSWRGELEITDAIQAMIDAGCRVASRSLAGWWKDTGTPEDMLDANRLVLDERAVTFDGTTDSPAETHGYVEIHESADIAETAVIDGPVSIGRDVTIGAETYVGPHTSIGRGSKLQGCHIEHSLIVGDADISTDARLVDSLIGWGTTIEPQAPEDGGGRSVVVGREATLHL